MEELMVRCFHILSFLKTQCGNDPDFRVNKIVKCYSHYCNRYNTIQCDLCKSATVAVRYCKHCIGYLDGLCFGFHVKMKHLVDHQVIDFRERRFSMLEFVPKMFCHRTGHTKHVLDAYCVNCNRLICQRCIKKHEQRNHDLNSLPELFHLLSATFEMKELLINTQKRLPSHPDHIRTELILSRIIRWIERTFDFNCTEINEENEPRVVMELLQREMRERGGTHLSPTMYSKHYVSCKSVLEKMAHLQKDLNNLQPVRNKELFRTDIGNVREVERGETAYTNTPYKATTERRYLPTEDSDDSSLSSTESSGSFSEINGGVSLLMRSNNNITMNNEVEPASIKQPLNNTEDHSKPIEDDILTLKKADENFKHDSFHNLHPRQ